jgi:hypothetical protein
MEEDVLASEIRSVGSCDEDVRPADETGLDALSIDKVYLKTHAGTCLQTVLHTLMASKKINVIQKSELEKEFNRIYRESFAQCRHKLHLNLSARLKEYAVVEAGSIFRIDQCVVSGPSSTLRVPEGQANLVFAPKY